MDKKIKPYYKENINIKPFANTQIRSNNKNRSWFYANELVNIYKIPKPTSNKVIISVVSFGGGVYGNIDSNGILTNGDPQQYWQSIGIASNNMPKVVIKTINGATNNPDVQDGGSTIENTIDIQCIGAACPTSNLTIVLYIAPNSFDEFPKIINAILNDSIYKPNVISISWGAPEVYYSNNLLTSMNNLFAKAISKNINITAASGDNGSNNGVGGTGSYCDFPSSSPNVTACGGTNLICPNLIYDNNTIETAWSNGGGAISHFFNKPTYQKNLPGSKRLSPDIALNADPNTGVCFLINGNLHIIGGTSIVSPIFAGYLAATNTTQFINPIIYNTNSICFNDIKLGSNGNYTTKTGYDNCTGFGSIKGDILNNIIKYSLKLANSTINLKLNSTVTLSNSVSSNLNKYIKWTSNNNKIVTVNTNGLITTKGIGKTIINITTINPYVNGTITVNVSLSNNNKIIPASVLLLLKNSKKN